MFPLVTVLSVSDTYSRMIDYNLSVALLSIVEISVQFVIHVVPHLLIHA